MADPFDVRMRFTNMLQHLNASVTSAQKAASYALKNREMDEDLHSCILEQLDRNNMNNRANIMYFIEHLCDLSVRESHLAYVQMMQRDIQHVIDAVAPPDGSGAANVKVARRVVQALQSKRLLEDSIVQDLEKCLKERDTAAHPALDFEITNGSSRSRPNGVARLDKRQIEQRIEEDRERHKRLRESIWAVSGENDDEYEKMWDEASDIGEDDYLAAEEDAEERRKVAQYG